MSEVKAVCVLIQYGTRYLGVTRRGKPDEWGLPGGKIETGEGPVEAAIRELKEETGLDIRVDDMEQVFVSKDRIGDDGELYDVITYRVREWRGKLLRIGDAGFVDFVPRKKLLEGPFGDYNKELFEYIYYKTSNERKIESNLWIQVSDRLPGIGLRVRAWHFGYETHGVCLTNGAWLLERQKKVCNDGEVSHWQYVDGPDEST